MPWNEVSIVDQRREFVRLAKQEGANRRELCRRFGIHPETAYKWLKRFEEGDRALSDRSRRPHSSPGRSASEIENAVLAVRDAHPAWGARKIVGCLARAAAEAPSPSPAHAILRRHNRIVPRPGAAVRVFGITVAYAAVIGAFNWLTGSNYMYLAAPPENPSLLSLLGPWPWYLLSATGVAIVLFAVLDAPFRLTRGRASLDAPVASR